jgi:hypothetical protein
MPLTNNTLRASHRPPNARRGGWKCKDWARPEETAVKSA